MMGEKRWKDNKIVDVVEWPTLPIPPVKKNKLRTTGGTICDCDCACWGSHEPS